MEERSSLKLKFTQDQHPVSPAISVVYQPSTLKEGQRCLKRDALKQKKRNKLFPAKNPPIQEVQTDHLSGKHKSDEDHSTASQENERRLANLHSQKNIENCLLSIIGLVNKPPYVSANSKNKISGEFGHATVFFQRPLIQGSYYIEFTVKEDARKDKKTKYSSAIRIGICEANFSSAFPLGCKESIGYKSQDGAIIYRNQKIGNGQPYRVGDTMGICLKLSPLQKMRDSNATSEGSSLLFFKNGKLVFEFKQLKQVFYCLGVSVYNYSQIQVKMSEECSYIKEAVHYFKSLRQKVPYKDLESNRIFEL